MKRLQGGGIGAGESVVVREITEDGTDLDERVGFLASPDGSRGELALELVDHLDRVALFVEASAYRAQLATTASGHVATGGQSLADHRQQEGGDRVGGEGAVRATVSRTPGLENRSSSAPW